ncbi:MAG: RNA pseudouridine synthase, partial [Bacteroidota bacterium]
AAVGCPIIGDEKYGSTVDPHHRHIALHARSLTLLIPGDEERKTIYAPIPKERWWLSLVQKTEK